MSATLDADVNIILNSKDHASEVVEEATKRINKSFRQMRAENRALTGAFELQHRSLMQAGRAIHTLGSVAQRAISIFNTWQLMQIRQNQLTDRRIALEKELAEAIASGDFERAADIQRDLNKAIEEQNRMLVESIGFWITAGLVAAGQITKITRAIPAITRFRNRLGGNARPATVTGAPSGTAPAPRAARGLRIPAGLRGALGGAAAAGPAIALWLAQMMGEQQAGAAEFNPATGQFEQRELPGGFDQIKDLLFKTDSSKKIAINVKVENEMQSAEVDLDTGQVTYGGG